MMTSPLISLPIEGSTMRIFPSEKILLNDIIIAIIAIIANIIKSANL